MSRFYLVTIVAMGLFTSPYVWAGMNKHETSIATYGYKIPIIVNTTQQSDNDLKSDIDQNKIPMVQDTGVVKPLQVPQDKVVAPASMSVPAPVIVPVPEVFQPALVTVITMLPDSSFMANTLTCPFTPAAKVAVSAATVLK
jgi:hypothetical protein